MNTDKKGTLSKVAAAAIKHGEAGYFGEICRTWLKQIQVPAKLIAKDK